MERKKQGNIPHENCAAFLIEKRKSIALTLLSPKSSPPKQADIKWKFFSPLKMYAENHRPQETLDCQLILRGFLMFKRKLDDIFCFMGTFCKDILMKESVQPVHIVIPCVNIGQ